MKPAEMDDAAIIKLVTAGDTEAYRGIVQRYQKRIYSYAHSILRNEADAADITQEVFIRFYNNISQFDCRYPLMPYLLKITVNCSRNLLKKKKIPTFSEFETDDESNAFENFADTCDNPLAGLMKKEKIRKVREFIHELPVTLREVCSLFYLTECSCSETAQILKISESSVKVALFRAREKLLHRFLLEWRTE